MWRALLLGKLTVSILASFIVGVICVSQPWRHEYSMMASARWIGTGAFLLVLSAVQIWVIYFLMKKRT